MTEFWQSQGKKFCDFCKCWLTDNKPSIAFHENGKKHKENVEKRIKEVRKRGIQVRKDDDELKKNLQAIEDAAMEAYKKDIGKDDIGHSTESSAGKRDSTVSLQTPILTSSEQTTSGCKITYIDGQPVAKCLHNWSVLQTPEGYYYYYNTHTQATQWEVPNCLHIGDSEEEEQAVQKKESVVGSTESSSNAEKSFVKEEKRQDEYPSKSDSPYGSWTAVRTIEAPTSAREDEIKESLARREERKTNQTAPEDPELNAKKTEAKFVERQTPQLSSLHTDEAVPFKKRKFIPEKKKNIRQIKLDT